MKPQGLNPSRIRRNPSRDVTDSSTKQVGRELCGQSGMRSVTYPSRISVTDFGRRKPLKYKEKLSLTMCKYKSVTRCRAQRLCVREGGVMDSRDGFESWRSRSVAVVACGRHVCIVARVPPQVRLPRAARHVANVWPTARLPRWQSDRYSARQICQETPAGTVARLSSLSFAVRSCPVSVNANLKRG